MSDDPASLPPNFPKDWVAPKVTVSQMLFAMREEADRIVESQLALLAASMRSRPDEGQLRKAIAIHRAERFVCRCAPYMREITDLLTRLERRGPGRG